MSKNLRRTNPSSQKPKGGQKSASTRSRAARSEYDDDVMRGNVIIDNKHQRALRVHERAKNVVSRTIDKEALLFKQRQEANRARLPNLNPQGRKKRLLTSSTRTTLSHPEGTTWAPDFQTNPTVHENPTQKSETMLAVPKAERKSSSSTSPLSPVSPLLTPRSEYLVSPSNHFQFPEYMSQQSKESNDSLSPDILVRTENISLENDPNRASPSPTDPAGVKVTHRRLTRVGSKERPDEFDYFPRRSRSFSRGLYLDNHGRLREETVFDFLSKPKCNDELQKRRDIRTRLEKEFSKPPPINKADLPKTVKKATILASDFDYLSAISTKLY